MKHFLRESDQFFAEYMPLVTRRLFYVLVAVALLMGALSLFGSIAPYTQRLFVLRPDQAVLQGNVWQLFTYMFAHAGGMHLLGNILGLFFFGGLIERQMGGRRFFWFVIIAGLVAGLAHTGLAFIVGRPDTGLIGFSAAVFAIITAAVIWFPRMRVLVMFLFPVPLRLLAAFFGFFMLLDIFRDIQTGGLLGSGGVSNLAHVSGILVGVLFVKNPRLLDFFEDLRIPGTRRRPRKVSGQSRTSMGHPGRHSDPDDLYDDPHWKMDQ